MTQNSPRDVGVVPTTGSGPSAVAQSFGIKSFPPHTGAELPLWEAKWTEHVGGRANDSLSCDDDRLSRVDEENA